MRKRIVFILAAATVWLSALENGNFQHAQAADTPGGFDTLSKETRAILDQSETLVLISTDPTPLGRDEKTNIKKRFHYHVVLGQTEIKGAKRKGELLSALYGGVHEYRKGLPGCFNPRHGIIAVAGTNRVELLICLECGMVHEFVNSNESLCLIDDSPREIFNRILREAGVPLAKK